MAERDKLILGARAPSLPVLTGSFQIGSTFEQSPVNHSVTLTRKDMRRLSLPFLLLCCLLNVSVVYSQANRRAAMDYVSRGTKELELGNLDPALACDVLKVANQGLIQIEPLCTLIFAVADITALPSRKEKTPHNRLAP